MRVPSLPSERTITNYFVRFPEGGRFPFLPMRVLGKQKIDRMESQIKRTPARSAWIPALGEILLVFLPAVLFMKSINSWIGADPIRNMVVVWVANILMLAMVRTSIKLRNRPWKDLGLTFPQVNFKDGFRVFGLSLIVFVIGISAFLFGSIVSAAISGIPESADLSRYDFLRDNPWALALSLVGVWIVSSFGEEVIYRGFLIQVISEMTGTSRYRITVAVILSSIIFGLAHYEWGVLGMIQTGCMGLAMGICYITLRKRLCILILAHAYMDTILLVRLYLVSN